MNDSNITRADFLTWRKNLVTKEVFSIWGDMVASIEEAMQDPSLIRGGTKGQLRLNELLGYKTALKDILEFEIIDNVEEQEEPEEND